MNSMQPSSRSSQSASPEEPRLWVRRVSAGTDVRFKATVAGEGAAIFVWSATDPYEQLSDAYTFMELRKVYPDRGDHLYSTQRRPILTLEAKSPDRSLDLLRHDRWYPRDCCIEALGPSILDIAGSVPAPKSWPYAINLFAKTLVTPDGALVDEPLPAASDRSIDLVARFDVIFAVVAAKSVLISTA